METLLRIDEDRDSTTVDEDGGRWTSRRLLTLALLLAPVAIILVTHREIGQVVYEPEAG